MHKQLGHRCLSIPLQAYRDTQHKLCCIRTLIILQVWREIKSICLLFRKNAFSTTKGQLFSNVASFPVRLCLTPI